MEPQPASASESVLVRWMSVIDTNTAGFVHGGTVMKLCDEVAGIAAIRHSRRRVVTAGMDRMTFLEPVELGDLVTVRASVNAVWRTSMEVGVRVEAERPGTGRVRHTSSAYLTMVALDGEGRPTEVPPLQVDHPTHVRRQREAQTRRDNRLAEREQLKLALEAEAAAEARAGTGVGAEAGTGAEARAGTGVGAGAGTGVG